MFKWFILSKSVGICSQPQHGRWTPHFTIRDEIGLLRLRQCSSFKYSEHIPLNKSMNVHSAGVLTLYTCATCVISCFLQLVPGGLQPQQRPSEADVAAHGGLPHTGQQDCRPGWLLHLCQVQCVTIYCPINSFYRTVTNRRRDGPLRLMSCVHISNKNQMITSK